MAHEISSTAAAEALGANYSAFSHFEHGRAQSIGRGIGIPEYIAALVKLTGKSAADLGLADLVPEGVAA